MPSSMPWIKLYTETLDDPKLGRLDDAGRWRFISLLLLAGECDAEGYLAHGDDQPMSLDDIAWRLRVDLRALSGEIQHLESVGVIESTDKGWMVCKFSERQGRSQSERRRQWRESKAKLRAESRGPEWIDENVLKESNRTPKGTVGQSKLSPTPRGEVEVEEKILAPTPPAQDGEPDPVKILAEVFEKAAGIALPTPEGPKAKKQVGVTWWNPLREMVKMADGRAPDVMRRTVAKMRADRLNISSPLSVEKVFTSLNGEQQARPNYVSRTPEL